MAVSSLKIMMLGKSRRAIGAVRVPGKPPEEPLLDHQVNLAYDLSDDAWERLKNDQCPVKHCGSDLDTGWECTECGFDGRPWVGYVKPELAN